MSLWQSVSLEGLRGGLLQQLCFLCIYSAVHRYFCRSSGPHVFVLQLPHIPVLWNGNLGYMNFCQKRFWNPMLLQQWQGRLLDFLLVIKRLLAWSDIFMAGEVSAAALSSSCDLIVELWTPPPIPPPPTTNVSSMSSSLVLFIFLDRFRSSVSKKTLVVELSV